MKKLTISLGLICILAVMTALIIAVGMPKQKEAIESMEIDLTFDDDSSPYQYIFTHEDDRFLMKYKPGYCDEWQEYKITRSEFYTVAGVDISNYADYEGAWYFNMEPHIKKKYKDEHTQETTAYLPNVNNSLIRITEKYGLEEPIYLSIDRIYTVPLLFSPNPPSVYYIHDTDGYSICYKPESSDKWDKSNITEDEFKTITSAEFPQNACRLINDTKYFSINRHHDYDFYKPNDSEIYHFFVIRQYNNNKVEILSGHNLPDPLPHI